MNAPSEKLANALEALKQLQDQGVVAIPSKVLSRTHRERLQKNGFIREVIKGWYTPCSPDEKPGDSTSWYASYWDFCAAYLHERFEEEWCLSAEQSLSLHIGDRTVPLQLIVRTAKGRNRPTEFLHNTSIFDVKLALPEPPERVKIEGLNVHSLPSALVHCSKKHFVDDPTSIRAALSMITDASDVLTLLLEGGHSVVAGRLVGAFRNIGRDLIADNIVKAMSAADFKVQETDPFEGESAIQFGRRELSPYVNRMRLMWAEMREVVINHFPEAPSTLLNSQAYLNEVEEKYVSDAYHSLSIEGYRVTPELIESIRSGEWNPDQHIGDQHHQNALAARGYWEAYQSVKKSIAKVLDGEQAGRVFEEDHSEWYFSLFGPNVTAGLLEQKALAGYRNGPVFIRCSMHSPPSREAIRDMMPALFDLLIEEKSAAVRVVLGHFFFVYIHPYFDGNGRMGRFLMNLMMASGGYSWTVVPVEQREAYMSALESASVKQDIVPFTQFIASLVLAL